MGPLTGMKILEFSGLGPAPFCGMLLSDFGADVVRLDRIDGVGPEPTATVDAALGRGRRSLAVDLKHAQGRELALALAAESDALIEGFRPGVMERLGLGPEACLERNPRLVYGRVTGWGREGPYAQMAGHDLNFIALSGTLDAIGRRGEAPVPPLNLIGDFGGGGMLLALGVLAAILHAARTGEGQVVDAAMLDGAALLMTMFHGLRAAGEWVDERGSNFNDTGSHFYNVYETADGRHMSIAAIEPRFYAELIERLKLDGEVLPAQYDRRGWPGMKHLFAGVFKEKTLAEWCSELEGTDVCFAPVLSMREAPRHLHNVERRIFEQVDGAVMPAPAPRFSRTPAAIQSPPARAGEHTDAVLREHGLSAARIEDIRRARVIA